MEKKAAGGATAVRLDGAQREAVECPAARLLVAAGPGSGKTAVLAARCARLAARGDGGGILALTFTNRAALEMRRRVGAVLDELGKERRPAGQCRVTTFHAFALEVVKAEGLASRLLGRQAQLALLSELGAETPAAALERISAAKGRRGRSAPPLPPLSGGDDDPLLRAYEKARRALDAVDLDDLVPAAVDLFASRPEVLAAYRARFRHVMVDEFQDIDPLQAALLELLAGPENTLFAIGDPDQAIYGFRGANLEGFLDFENRHDGARVLTLDANYRSSASIVGASASLIRHNRVRLERELRAVREPGEPVRAVECADERAEARFIAGEIERLMGGLASLTTGRAEQSGGYGFSDFAVLVRTNRRCEEMAALFEESSVPCRVVGPPDGDLADLCARLQALCDDDGYWSGMEAPPPDLTRLVEAEASKLAVGEGAVKSLLSAASLLEDDAGHDAQGRGGAQGLRAALAALVESAALMTPADRLEIEAEAVTVMTLHSAKGLEFPVVFIAGAEDGTIPLCRGRETAPDDMEEERRLFYVAVTRAKQRLYITSARRRLVYGAVRQTVPSPFIRELGESFVTAARLEKKTRKRRPVQKGLFD